MPGTTCGSCPGRSLDLHGPATLLGLLTLGILIAWQFLPNGRLKKVPGPLVAVVGGTVVAAVMNADVARVQLAADALSAIKLPSLPEGSAWGAFFVAVLSLALVASAESLLSAVATDKLHTGPRANLDRELLAQGVANTLSGLVGGLPITGVIVRSAANINAGAKTRWSAVLHAVWMLAFVTLLGGLASYVPLTVLAGLLVHVGLKLVNLAHIRELRHRGELPVYLITVAGVVGINLLAGIGLGTRRRHPPAPVAARPGARGEPRRQWRSPGQHQRSADVRRGAEAVDGAREDSLGLQGGGGRGGEHARPLRLRGARELG